MSTMWRLVRVGGFGALWALAAAAMVSSALSDPFDSRREGTRAYGHNSPGALPVALALTLLELGVLYALMRPWSYRRSWGRAAVALLLFAPWTLASMLATMHAGGIVAVHFLWLAAVTLTLGLSLCASIFAALRARAGSQPDASDKHALASR